MTWTFRLSDLYLIRKEHVSVTLFYTGMLIAFLGSMHPWFLWPLGSHYPLLAAMFTTASMMVSNTMSTPVFCRKDFFLPLTAFFLFAAYECMSIGSNINAYIMLQQGKHFVNWLNILIMFIVYTTVGTFYLRGTSFQTLFSNPWLGVLMSFLSTATLFLVIAIIAFWHDIAFNMWVPTTIYSLIDTYVQKRNIFNKKKNEKIHSTTGA